MVQKRSCRQTGRKASGQAELIGKNAEKMFTAAAVTLARDRWQLPNGGLNLHTPTISVCKKINEDANCMLLAEREKAMRAQETGSKSMVTQYKDGCREQDLKRGRFQIRTKDLEKNMLFNCVYSSTGDAAYLIQWENGSAFKCVEALNQCYFWMWSLRQSGFWSWRRWRSMYSSMEGDSSVVRSQTAQRLLLTRPAKSCAWDGVMENIYIFHYFIKSHKMPHH